MDAITFYKSNETRTIESVCERAGTNLAYFKQIAYGHRKPSPALARRLEQESEGAMTRRQLRPDIFADQ